MTIGERIKNRRLKLGLSVDELARKLGKNRATIYRYENNDIGNLPITVLEPLAIALETSPAYLMGWVPSTDDGIIDYYDDTLEKAITYLQKHGYAVERSESPNDDSLIIKNNDSQIIQCISEGDLVNQYEHLRLKETPLTVEKLLSVESIDILPENIRAAARGMMDLSPDDQKTAIDMINYLSQKGKEAKDN